MEATLRVFIGIEVTDGLIQAVSPFMAELAKQRVPGLRPTGVYNLHLTLKFLGDISPNELRRSILAVSRAVSTLRPFTVNIGGVEFLPSVQQAQVLSCALQGCRKNLIRLHSAVEQAMLPLGFPKGKGYFRPHITLARLNRRIAPDGRRLIVKRFSGFSGPYASDFLVDRVSFVQSILSPRGSKYQSLTMIPLGKDE